MKAKMLCLESDVSLSSIIRLCNTGKTYLSYELLQETTEIQDLVIYFKTSLAGVIMCITLLKIC